MQGAPPSCASRSMSVDAALPDVHTRSNAAGAAVGERAVALERQSVDLANFLVVGRDEHGAARDAVLRPIARTRGAKGEALDRAHDVVALDDIMLGFAGPMIGFARGCPRASAEVERQPVTISSARREALLHQARHAGRLDGLELVRGDDRGDEAGHSPYRCPLLRADRIVEVHLHLEQARKVGIALRQLSVEIAVADEDDFDIERDGLRHERPRRMRPPRYRRQAPSVMQPDASARLSQLQDAGVEVT